MFDETQSVTQYLKGLVTMGISSRQSGQQGQMQSAQTEPFAKKKSPDKKKRIKIAVIAAVSVIAILVALSVLDLFPHTDGSLHLTAGKLLGTDDNDIIVNRRTNDNKKDNYYKLGSFDMPEGYALDEDNGISASSRTQLSICGRLIPKARTSC